MQRQIHTYRAATMQDALELVRQELGQDAVVVHSKQVATRRLLPWPSTRQEIEISAERSLRPARSPHQSRPGTSSSRTIRTLAESIGDPVKKPRLLEPIREIESDLAEAIRDDIGMSDSKINLSPAADQSFPTDFPVTSIESPDADLNRTMLETLQQMIARLERQSTARPAIEIPSDLIPLYHKILEKEIDVDIARDLMMKLRHFATSDLADSSSTVTTTLTALVEREMRMRAPPIQPKSGRREIVTLVGPTGVGKTTTLAKLAGRFHLQEGVRIGLITVDHYRVGAIEQLQTYADILDVPLRAVSNANELRLAIDAMDNVDLILIDTAGRSPFDAAKMDELRELVNVATSDHVMLVMSLAAGGASLVRIADQFSVVSPTSLVMTKIDESHRSGGLLTVAREIPYPIRYLTTGQDVPDHIEPAHPNRLARLILGCDQIR